MMPQTDTSISARQNAELTFKFNQHSGRHGWLRLTPAYSLRLVSDILTASDKGIRVLDPFSGTGTTPLCAAYAGDNGTGVEINPFLAWLGKAKLARYTPSCVRDTREALSELISQAKEGDSKSASPPAMHNLYRWWDPGPLDFLCRFKAALDNVAAKGNAARDLLSVVFCRLVIKFSNAAFNHQSMSFKDRAGKGSSYQRQGLLFNTEPDHAESARVEGRHVIGSAADNPSGTGIIVAGDSRSVSTAVAGKYDLLITSPPYPNRISYIRELRPYMYWLGYIETGRDAGEMDWSAIGGTWGIATSRLAEWQRSSDGFYPRYFDELLSKIGHSDNKSGALLSNYVAKYFEDMWQHIKDVYEVMATGATVHYIVGNSTFYQVLVPVEQLFAEMLTEAGFRNASIKRIRKRNSKKELYEFDVNATK